MKAGVLNEVVEIYSPKVQKNKFNEDFEEWEYKLKTRANVIHDSGSRDNDNGEIFYSHIKTLQLRHYVKIDSFDRVKWRDSFYRILDIEPNRQLMMQTIKIELIND